MGANALLFSGVEVLIRERRTFGFENENPWWKPGALTAIYSEIVAHGHDEETLERRGFTRLMRSAYEERMRPEVLRYMLAEEHTGKDVAALITLYSVGRYQRVRIEALYQEVHERLLKETGRSLQHESTAVPKRGLFPIPLEMNNLSSYYRGIIQDESRLTLDPEKTPKSARFMVTPDGQGALFYDAQLAHFNNSERISQGIEVPLERPQGSEVEAIVSALSALEELGVSKETLRHVPRVIAGIFTAAHRDQWSAEVSGGSFFDTPSGSRLCELIGFNSQSSYHRTTVQAVRNLLCRVKLHREVKQLDPTTSEYRLSRWSGYLLTQSEGEELYIETGRESEGRREVVSQETRHKYRIGDAFWHMVTGTKHGGAPDFMRLDTRAFQLDVGNSTYFNLYWSLVNRATTDGIGEDQAYVLRLRTLLKWAGLQDTYPSPSRLKPVLKQWLNRCVALGLLDSWQCPELGDDPITMQDLEEATLGLVFSESQSTTLPNATILSRTRSKPLL